MNEIKNKILQKNKEYGMTTPTKIKCSCGCSITTKRAVVYCLKCGAQFIFEPEQDEQADIEGYKLLQTGVLSVESTIPIGSRDGVFEVLVGKDGRVWINYEGWCMIRFTPDTKINKYSDAI